MGYKYDNRTNELCKMGFLNNINTQRYEYNDGDLSISIDYLTISLVDTSITKWERIVGDFKIKIREGNINKILNK